MQDSSVHSVGLAGDGDEVAAIQEVEREFSVRLDYSDAPTWVTAGDVFQSLTAVLGVSASTTGSEWTRFAAVLARETGTDAALIEPASPLLLPQSHFWARVTDLSAVVWLGAAILLIGTITVAAVF